ncbi:V-type ATP synthase subunit B [Candidatus Geothermarchaeota archaeon ex4572_27]|nr:MAG: V-type ATP synthase subunit B [Candidatus Geothermarchaeota archaeon ex4572_27]
MLDFRDIPGAIHRRVKEIRGSLITLDPIPGVGYDEIVKVRAPDGIDRLGRVLEVGEDGIVVQVFGEEMGLQTDSVVKFTGSAFEVPVSEDCLGRMFNGRFEPIDGLPPIYRGEKRDIYGSPINPRARIHPREFIQTGISAIDGMLSLVRGQKLPIFSESGLPHNRIIAQIARQATVPGKEEEFAIVFAAMGLKNDEARYFIEEFRNSGAIERSVVILNLADDPAIERILTPRIALTIAEYLAFDCGYHVLTILSDMTNYCEALREISAARGEIPGRAGYPGYMYSDLATIYERAGVIQGKPGSLTQMPVLTMPGGDLRHPIPDLTGYITEGQIILSKDLHTRGIYPPINVLPSLSRLMRGGIGPGKTREDHRELSDQLYDAYSRGLKARDLARIVGEVGLSERERLYLKFADLFERKFLSQGEYENRTIEETLDLGWEVLAILPEEELVRVKEETIEKYYRPARKRVLGG